MKVSLQHHFPESFGVLPGGGGEAWLEICACVNAVGLTMI